MFFLFYFLTCFIFLDVTLILKVISALLLSCKDKIFTACM
nr:MAG TPA: hypothetical protein [Caudoviricetes sp.]